jgi:hypothetical protein
MPFGAGFVIAFVVLPAFLGCNVEDDELTVVLSGFGKREEFFLTSPLIGLIEGRYETG